jgi:hypothetical protein
LDFEAREKELRQLTQDSILLYLNTRNRLQTPSELVRKLYRDITIIIQVLAIWAQYTTIIYTPLLLLQYNLKTGESDPSNQESHDPATTLANERNRIL